jgi:hypothetical protein
MSSIGVWVAFLKQPALRGKAPQTNKKFKKINITNESKVVYFYFLGGAQPGSASGCFKKATQIPNAGHPI